ncbi:MAG: alkaline phosphatase family protein [Anaerolineales bacterium]|nr:alkaline phosphatase family protein [Anaerolineales bacterium]
MKINRKFFIYVLFLMLIIACQSSGVPATATIALTTPTVTSVPTLTLTPIPTITSTLEPATKHVIILSIDGLRPDAIQLAPMPNLLELMKTSAYTLTAQTVHPSATLPAHASMLTGLCPAKHGVDWNDYLPENGIAQGIDLFDIAHAAGLQTVMYTGKEKLQQVTDASSVDKFVWINDRDKIVMQNLLADFPQDFGVLFIHFATTDDMGHVYGWLSPEQLSVVFRADEAIGELLAALDNKGLRDETLLIITADHGGHGMIHGSSMPEDMTIPWIASGPEIEAKQLQMPVHTMDTAATAAYALGLSIPEEWDGVPVYEALGLPAANESKACE